MQGTRPCGLSRRKRQIDTTADVHRMTIIPSVGANVPSITSNRYHKNIFFLFLYYAFFFDRFQYFFFKPVSGLSYELITPAAHAPGGQTASIVDVVIIGGGPVGLATALTLSRPPHNCQVCVVESNPRVDYYDPTKAFLYNINARGLKFITKFPRLYEKLQHSAVKSQSMRNNFMIVPADPNTPLPSADSKEDETFDINKVSFWLPRHEFTRIIKEVAEEENLNFQRQKLKNTQTDNNHNVGSISLLFGMECLDVLPSAVVDVDGDNSYGVELRLKNITSNYLSTVRCNLAIGADGYKSSVCQNFTFAFDSIGTGL
jgi:2-polyprenyl-6-methoxyphenol hydroxylase-like FAD-dependent oxidoreductase